LVSDYKSVVNIQVELFWVVMLCNVKMEAACITETLVSYRSIWHHNPKELKSLPLLKQNFSC